MKFAIVYTPNLADQHPYLIKEAKKKYDKVLVVPIERIKFEYSEEGSKILYNKTDLSEFDVVFPRLSGDDLLMGEQLVEMLSDSSCYTHMDPDSFSIASNKFLMMDILNEGRLNIPRSIYTLSTKTAVEAADDMGYPIVIKLISGYAGKGIMRASQKSELRPIIDTLEIFEQDICLQDYIENPGEDIRILVIGDETYSYKRIGDKESEEWRSNISIGGDRKKYDAPEEMRQMAIKAAKLSGFDMCGVDIMESEEGPYIVEINASPGIAEGTSEIIGINLPKKMIEFTYKKALEKQVENNI